MSVAEVQVRNFRSIKELTLHPDARAPVNLLVRGGEREHPARSCQKRILT